MFFTRNFECFVFITGAIRHLRSGSGSSSARSTPRKHTDQEIEPDSGAHNGLEFSKNANQAHDEELPQAQVDLLNKDYPLAATLATPEADFSELKALENSNEVPPDTTECLVHSHTHTRRAHKVKLFKIAIFSPFFKCFSKVRSVVNMALVNGIKCWRTNHASPTVSEASDTEPLTREQSLQMEVVALRKENEALRAQVYMTQMNTMSDNIFQGAASGFLDILHGTEDDAVEEAAADVEEDNP